MSRPIQPPISQKPSIKSLIQFHLNIATESENVFLANKKRIVTRNLTIGHLQSRYISFDSKLLDRHIRHRKTLKSLTFNPGYQTFLSERTKITRENLKGLKSLRKIHFYMRDSNRYEDHALSILSKGVRQLSLLKNFGLSADYSEWFNDESLINITHALKYFSSLNSIKISTIKCHRLDETGFLNVLVRLKRFKTLQALDINLTGCSQIREKSIKALGEAFSKWPDLAKFSLFLENTAVQNPEGIQSICTNLIEFKALKTLTLDFFKSSFIRTTHQNFIIFHHLENLNLNLNIFGTTDLHAKSLESLPESLENLKSLKGLSFTLGNPYVSDTEIQCFHKSLGNFASLQSLQLSYIYCFITDQSLISLAGTLKATNLLKNIDLEFIYHDISDQAFVNLSQGIGCHPHLQHINLNFVRGNITQVSDKGLITLGESLEQIKNLKSFNLSLASYEVGDEEMNSLCQGLARHSSELNSLKLYFGSSVFTDKSLKNLIENLRTLRKLATLIIKFNSCHGITDEGHIELAPVLLDLKILKDFQVTFDNCHKVSKEEVKKLMRRWEVIKE